MKKFLLPLALMSALLVSCEKQVQEEYYDIWIDSHELHFALYGEEQSVTVDSSHDWELTDCPDWCIPSIKGGQSGAEVIFTVTENDSDSQREGKIIFSCGNASDSISVLQDGINSNIKFSSESIKESLTSEHREVFNGQRVIIDIDRDNDGEISYKEALDAKYMYINTGVTSDNFTELKYFPALEYAYINLWSLDSIDLTHCPNLKYLYISGDIPSLDLSNNTSLEHLECRNNDDITSLDLSNNSALEYLVCSYNQLTSLDVSSNTALTYLDCYKNQLTSLDVSKNTALTHLYCGGNQLTSLDVSNNTALTWLSCNYNQLTSLDLSNNTALTDLGCNYNQLTSLDLSNNTALTVMSCEYNQLTSLDVSKNRLIERLIIRDNPLQKLILYKYHIIKDSDMEDIESEYGDIIEYVE